MKHPGRKMEVFKSASWFYQKLSETNKQKSSIQQAFIAAITPG
jgi:hypothetical protein